MDIVIRGGVVIDGDLSEPREMDVAIKDGLIAKVGRVSETGNEEIDARGKIVTPGFVDIHTHYDGQAIWSEHMTPSSNHGVTTAVIGNCGVGFAPCRQNDRELLIGVMEGVEDIPGAVLADGLDWEWETYPEYLEALDRRPRDIDIASLFPHMPMRVYVMGQRGADREPATVDDLSRMYAITREALAAGALGVATSQLFTHRTRDGELVPTFGVAEEELQAIARAVRDSGGGVWQGPLSSIAGRHPHEDIALLDRIVQTTGGSGMYSLGQLPTDPDGWRGQLAELTRLNSAGSNIKAQVFPRGHAVLVNFDLTVHPFCLSPSYMEIAHLPLKEKIQRLRDPSMRARLLREQPVDIGQPFYEMGRHFDKMFTLSDPPNYEPAADASIAAIAQSWGVDPLEMAYDLLLQKDGEAMLLLQFANYAENSLDFLPDMIRNPNTVLGLGDAGAHYGMICDGTFTTFLMSYWTRDRVGERLSLSEVVNMLSRRPALAVGLLDRGVVAEGFKADINVIDHDNLRLPYPHVASDLPAGGKRVTQGAHGYLATIANGQIILRDDRHTGALPGRLVRGKRAAPNG